MNNFNQNLGMNNNLYPKTQSPSYFNPTYGATTPTNNIIWVQGIEGAKAWQLNPNSMAILLDSEAEGKMYIKVSDNIGMSSLRTFNFVEEKNLSTKDTINKEMDLSSYVTKEELASAIKEVIDRYDQSISGIAGTGTPEPKSSAAADKVKSVTYISK